MPEVTERRATTIDRYVLEARRRLNRRIWLFTVGLLICIVAIIGMRPLYGRVTMAGGLAACVLFAACAWGIYLAHEERSGLPLPVTERVSVMQQVTPDIPMRLVQHVDNGGGVTLKLSSFEHTARDWRLLASRLAAQDWLFNRDVTPGILGNYSETWGDYLAEWREAGYLFKDGRSWYVQPWVRKALTSPHPSRQRVVEGWIVGDIDDDDHDDDEVDDAV